jgi:fused signal recognition particle receptor
MRGDDAEEAIREILRTKFSQKSRALTHGSGLRIVLVVGVNGTGKTTSVAKLATYLRAENKSVVLGAADTFRAAAVAQLTTWGERIGVETISGKEGAEPASVAFDSAKRALDVNAEYLLIDTAGRLHNKSALMDELGKVKRVVEKVAPITEVLLVIDATTGQNGLAQAKIFSEAVEVSGLIVTKLDGSARGGVALAIESALDIPIKFIGTGEGATDFALFDPEKYLEGLLT